MKDRIILRLEILLIDAENNFIELTPGEVGEMSRDCYIDYKKRQHLIDDLKEEIEHLRGLK